MAMWYTLRTAPSFSCVAVCRVQVSYLKVLAFGPGNVNDLHGFRRVDFFAWIMCFSYWSSVIVRWNLKESHRSADPAGVVLSLLSSPRLHVIQVCCCYCFNVIFCPQEMDKMLVNPVQVRNNFLLAQGLLASQDVKCFGLFLCAACFERILSSR